MSAQTRGFGAVNDIRATLRRLAAHNTALGFDSLVVSEFNYREERTDWVLKTRPFGGAWTCWQRSPDPQVIAEAIEQYRTMWDHQRVPFKQSEG